MFPYKDDNPTILTPYVTLLLIGLTSVIWLAYQGAGSEPALSNSVCDLGVIPGRLFGDPITPVRTPQGPITLCPDSSPAAWHTVLTSVFLHGKKPWRFTVS